MDNKTIINLSDADICALVERIYRSGANINLEVPYRPETVAAFLETFSCQRCGACCRGAGVAEISGVLLEPLEVETLAGALSVPRSRFKQDFTYVKNGRRILKYPCPFNADGSHVCLVYRKRPEICRTFPLHAPLPAADGTYLLVVAGVCPEGRRVAVEFIKTRRDIEKAVADLPAAERDRIRQNSRALWDRSHREQAQSGRFKGGE